MDFQIDHPAFSQALKSVVKPSGGPSNGGLDNHMWGAIVDRNGVVLAVACTGQPREQWPGSRTIAIEKANTASAVSLPTSAFSTAKQNTKTQPNRNQNGLVY